MEQNLVWFILSIAPALSNQIVLFSEEGSTNVSSLKLTELASIWVSNNDAAIANVRSVLTS